MEARYQLRQSPLMSFPAAFRHHHPAAETTR